MKPIASRGVRWFATAALLTAASLPSQAASWSYALAPGSLLSGGSLAGAFAGVDADGDGTVSLAELVSFDVSYTGAPGVTTSFSIDQPPDAFSFDLTAEQLVFSVTDVFSNSVSVNTYDGGSYSVLSATGPDAGSGALAISAVPEPSQLALLGDGALMMIGLAAARARRSRSTRQRSPSH